MATCRYCGKSGWLVSVTTNGLCNSCHDTHFNNILQNCRLYAKSVSAASKTRSTSAVLTNLIVASKCCLALQVYQEKGIPTIGMDLADALRMLDDSFNDAVEEAVDTIFQTARSKAAAASGDAGRLGAYATAAGQLSKLAAEFPAVVSFTEAGRKIQTEQDRLRFDLLLKRSDVAVAKGQKKKAHDLAVEALFALKHDATPDDLQTDMVRKAIDRIQALGGKVPSM